MKIRNLLAALSLSMAGLAAAAPQAGAAPLLCLESDVGIYQTPASLTGRPGDLISCRQVTLSQVPGNIPMTAWKVKYTSTDLNGKKIAVSGFVAVPRLPWTGGGTRPVVAFSPGTLGSGPQCAFSKQMAGAYQDAYEGDQIATFLKAGYAVAASDGVGYMDGQVHTYMIGHNAGHALLDIVRAAFQVPGGGLSPTTKVGISGYSEGGANSLWAAQLAGSYAPELKVVGAAAGGVPGDLKVTAAHMNAGPFAGFMVDANMGLHAAYPDLPYYSLMNDKGKDADAKAKTLCLFGTLAAFADGDIKDYTKDGLNLDRLYAIAGPGGTTWGEVVGRQKLGVNIGGPGSTARYKISFPTYQYRGLLEEIIPTSTQDGTRRAYCAAGVVTDAKMDYFGDHLTTDGQAKDDVTRWLGDRFAGRTTRGNC